MTHLTMCSIWCRMRAAVELSAVGSKAGLTGILSSCEPANESRLSLGPKRVDAVILLSTWLGREVRLFPFSLPGLECDASESSKCSCRSNTSREMSARDEVPPLNL